MGDEEWDASASNSFFSSGDLKGSGPSNRKHSIENAKEAGSYVPKSGKVEYRFTDAAEAAQTAAEARKRITAMMKQRAQADRSRKPGKPSKNLQAKVEAKFSRKEQREEADRMSSKKYRQQKKQEAFEAKAYGNGKSSKGGKGGKSGKKGGRR